MKYFLLLTLFAFFHSLSAQSYSSCFSYSSYYYYYSSNGARCCYKYSYSGSYKSTYYVYCPYYTTTPAPATTSISNYCRSYYYSYYYSNRCCYKSVKAYSTYYSNNYYYTTGDCDLTTTTTPAPTSCYSYYYSSSYGTKCCIFRDYSYSSSNYDQYCPSTSTLSSRCGGSCCTASVPVYNGYNIFYYSQYFCPTSSSNFYSYCGPFCGMAAAFGTLGFCCCICGLGFTIGSILLFIQTFNKKKSVVTHVSSAPTNQPTPAALEDSTVKMNQDWKQETLPPQIPGYSYTPNPANTTGVPPYPVHLGGATNVPPNPVHVPSIQTHGAASYPSFSQPVQTDVNAEENYAVIH